MPSAGEPLAVRRAVVAERRHHDRLAAQRLQVVRDVAGAAAPFAAHLADLERHRQHVRLLGQDVPREAIGEHHDGVVGERAADQRARDMSMGVLAGIAARSVRRARVRRRPRAAPSRGYRAPLLVLAADLADDRTAAGATPAASPGRPFSSTSQCASPSSPTRRSKPRMKSRATRQLRCTRTKRGPNSSSSRVSDSSSRYSRCGGADRDVLELGLEVDDLLDRDQHDARALGHRQEAPRGRRQLVELRRGHRLQPRHLLQRGEQPLHAHRLHQVVDRVDLERLQRVLVVAPS